MAYRPEWFPQDRNVLQIALDVHMTTTGSFERSEEEQEFDIKCLKHVLRNWKSGRPIDAPFDSQVHQLICVTLFEAKAL